MVSDFCPVADDRHSGVVRLRPQVQLASSKPNPIKVWNLDEAASPPFFDLFVENLDPRDHHSIDMDIPNTNY